MMKRAWTVVVILCLCGPFSSFSLAQTQMDLNETASKNATKAEAKLGAVVKGLSSNAAVASKLKAAQEKWKKFRDAHVDSIFPLEKTEDYRMQFGSIYPLCWFNYSKDMSDARLKDFRAWKTIGLLKSESAAKKQYTDADRELNSVYQQVMRSQAVEKFPSFKEKMTGAEQAWIEFRDADADAFAALRIGPQARIQRLATLTKARTKQLRVWLTGIPEGDGCSGSYPISSP